MMMMLVLCLLAGSQQTERDVCQLDSAMVYVVPLPST